MKHKNSASRGRPSRRKPTGQERRGASVFARHTDTEWEQIENVICGPLEIPANWISRND